MRRRSLLLVAVLAMVASACASDTEPPETVTSIVEVPGETVTSIVTEVVPGTTMTFWSTETQPARLQITLDIIERFEAASGIEVNLVPVDENGLSESMFAAAATGIAANGR